MGKTRGMRAPSPLPGGLGAVFSVRAARGAGVTARRLRASDLNSHFSGSRALPRSPSAGDEFARQRQLLLQRCREYASVAPADFCFSHVTAAALYGIPLPPRIRVDQLIDVSVPAVSAQPRRHGVRGHRLDAWHVRLVDRMPLLTAAVAWTQLSPLLTLDELVIAGDFLVRRKRPLCTLLQLRAAVSAPTRGAQQARTALLDVRSGTDSPPETETRLVLVRHGLPEPLVGYAVFHEGYFVGTPDLAYVQEKIAIEYQGSGHWLDHEVFEDDIIRRELFERAGWTVFLVTASRLRHPAQLAAEVAVLLRERAV